MEENKQVFESIIASVQKEFEGFEKEILKLMPKQIFEEHWKISFYCEMHGYICDRLSEDFEEEEVAILVGMQDVLYQAYQTYLGEDGFSFNTYDDDRETLEGLIEELKEAFEND